MRTFMLADERGSVVACSNESAAMTAINSYDEHGIPGSNAGRFGYTGQAWVPEIGMSYYKARIHSPTLGRFMQTEFHMNNSLSYIFYCYVNIYVVFSRIKSRSNATFDEKFTGTCAISAIWAAVAACIAALFFYTENNSIIYLVAITGAFVIISINYYVFHNARSVTLAIDNILRSDGGARMGLNIGSILIFFGAIVGLPVLIWLG